MKKFNRKMSGKLLVPFVLAMLTAPGTSGVFAGGPVEICSGKLMLAFASDGRPKSLKSSDTDKELLNEQNPGAGFELEGLDFSAGRPVSFPLKDLAFDGRQLAASIGDKVRITFEVKATDRYIAFKINRVEGIPKSNLLWLQFKMNVQGNVKTLPLDYMTRTGAWGCEISWPWIWSRHENSILGGFAIYVAGQRRR